MSRGSRPRGTQGASASQVPTQEYEGNVGALLLAWQRRCLSLQKQIGAKKMNGTRKGVTALQNELKTLEKLTAQLEFALADDPHSRTPNAVRELFDLPTLPSAAEQTIRDYSEEETRLAAREADETLRRMLLGLGDAVVGADQWTINTTDQVGFGRTKSNFDRLAQFHPRADATPYIHRSMQSQHSQQNQEHIAQERRNFQDILGRIAITNVASQESNT